MNVFVAGATGAIGRRLVPLLLDGGHEVTGMTRGAAGADALRAAGAGAAVANVLDAAAVRDAVAAARPDVVVHQLTDLGASDFAANARLRIVGTRNLVDAARAAGVQTMVAQSIAWLYAAGDGEATEADPLDPAGRGYDGVAALEAAVGDLERGVILRYGFFTGPGTWYASDGAFADAARARTLPATAAWATFVHVDDAAEAAVAALDWPAGPVNVVTRSAPGTAWVPELAAAVGAPSPPIDAEAPATGRPVSAALARSRGWRPTRQLF